MKVCKVKNLEQLLVEKGTQIAVNNISGGFYYDYYGDIFYLSPETKTAIIICRTTTFLENIRKKRNKHIILV